MGACCLEMLNPPKKDSEPKKPKPKEAAPETERCLTKTNIPKEDKNDSICGRGSILQNQSNLSVNTKAFIKNKSTALFSNVKQSICDQYTLENESIIVKGSNGNFSENLSPEKYYTLIDNVAFVKKTEDCIRVTSPDGQSEINCALKYLFTTLSVSEGRPIESILEVGPNKLIQVADSPIQLKLKLRCNSCKKKMKLTCCKGVLHMSTVECTSCNSKDAWSILDIESNAPIWGDGEKIDNHEELEVAPSVLRVMGCVNCFRFSNCSKLKCGCLLCNTCQKVDKEFSLDMQCRMCEGSYIL